jgi:hypothetical protein
MPFMRSRGGRPRPRHRQQGLQHQVHPPKEMGQGKGGKGKTLPKASLKALAPLTEVGVGMDLLSPDILQTTPPLVMETEQCPLLLPM